MNGIEGLGETSQDLSYEAYVEGVLGWNCRLDQKKTKGMTQRGATGGCEFPEIRNEKGSTLRSTVRGEIGPE